jgi:predicted DsbA family dithiol-disulfide isomerase
MIIDIVSDAICPWCFIGKRRLERALLQAPQSDVRIGWRPYQLNPEMPREGMDRKVYLKAKFGDETGGDRYDAIVAAGREEGIDFVFDRIKRTPNTILAHRLIRYSARENHQPRLVEALFRAYFTEGQDIGDADTLTAVAVAAGMDEAKTAAFLASSEEEDLIRQEDAFARQIGIQGVPCFIIDRQYAVSGAQPPEAFLEVFELAKQQGETATAPEVI